METILVIDDERATLAMFRLLLEAMGYAVLTAEDGREGVAVFERERPAIVLTDVKMPGMDGIAVLQRIKELAPATEVIVITGHGDMDLAIKALHLDATDFINKPIQRTILEKALERAHARRRLGREQAETITLERCGEAAVVHIHGAVNARSEARLQALFREAQGLGLPRIVLHFGDGATVNGAGIAVLTQLLQAGRREGCGVVAAGVSANLAKVFDIVGLAGQLPLFATLEEALT